MFFNPRTVQLTVSNALVGRIIGRGGMKINSIQVKNITAMCETVINFILIYISVLVIL